MSDLWRERRRLGIRISVAASRSYEDWHVTAQRRNGSVPRRSTARLVKVGPCPIDRALRDLHEGLLWVSEGIAGAEELVTAAREIIRALHPGRGRSWTTGGTT